MTTYSTMDRIKSIFNTPKKGDEEEYEPLTDDSGTIEGSTSSFFEQEDDGETPFSWIEYLIFALIGVAMLWAWYVLTP